MSFDAELALESPRKSSIEEEMKGCPSMDSLAEFWPERMLRLVLGPPDPGDLTRVRQSQITTDHVAVARALMPATHQEMTRRVASVDVNLELPDARSAILGNESLVAVDFNLYLLIHNIAVLQCRSKSFQLATGFTDSDGLGHMDVVNAMLEEIDAAIAREILCSEESILQPESPTEMANYFTYMSEIFIVAHELAHVLLSPVRVGKRRARREVHSLVLGHQGPGKEAVAVTARIGNWATEHAADRYASKIMMGCVRRYFARGPDQTWHWMFLCFVFHLLDVFARAAILRGKTLDALFRHPPLFQRLAFCGVPFELWEPASRLSGLPGFKEINSLFDYISIHYDVTSIRSSSGLEYFQWVDEYANLAPRVKSKVLGMERAYRQSTEKGGMR